MRKTVFLVACCALVVGGLSAPANAQRTSSGERGIDLSFGGGKTGIGKGYVASTEFKLFSRISMYPVVQYSWTGEASVPTDPFVAENGGTQRVSASQYSYALGADLMVERWRHWEIDVAAENGFQKTAFRYTTTVLGETYSGVEKRSGYYCLPEVKARYWLTRRSNLSVTFGMVAHGDPTGGDGLGRSIFLVRYTRRFDPTRLVRFFR